MHPIYGEKENTKPSLESRLSTKFIEDEKCEKSHLY